MSAPGEQVVRGLRAAARVTGRSASGVQKLIDAGRLPARRVGAAFEFAPADLELVRRAEPGVPSAVAVVSGETGTDIPRATPMPTVDHPGESGQPSSTGLRRDDGDIAALAFADFRAGRTVIDVVIDRRLPPDVVRHIHGEWLALSDVDDGQTPTALERLARVEAELALRASQSEVQTLGERLAGIEGSVRELAGQVTRGRQEVDARLRVIGARSSGVSVPGSIYERLSALEGQLRNLPAAPLLLPDRRCGCGAPLVVAASCSGCGVGRAAS